MLYLGIGGGIVIITLIYLYLKPSCCEDCDLCEPPPKQGHMSREEWVSLHKAARESSDSIAPPCDRRIL